MRVALAHWGGRGREYVAGTTSTKCTGSLEGEGEDNVIDICTCTLPCAICEDGDGNRVGDRDGGGVGVGVGDGAEL